MVSIDTKYFKKYRQRLGFSNQGDTKAFFAGKDIRPTVDFNYIALFNERLIEIIKKINELSDSSIKIENLDSFCNENIESVFNKLKNNDIIPRLNNQGRRPEQVYFSWKLTETPPLLSEIFLESI